MVTLERLSMYYAVSFDSFRKYESHHQFLGGSQLSAGGKYRQATSVSLVWKIATTALGDLHE